MRTAAIATTVVSPTPKNVDDVHLALLFRAIRPYAVISQRLVGIHRPTCLDDTLVTFDEWNSSLLLNELEEIQDGRSGLDLELSNLAVTRLHIDFERHRVTRLCSGRRREERNGEERGGKVLC